MSVLIKGIDKPKNSRECPFAVMAEDWEKECIVGGEYHWNNKRVCEGCPLVEIPKPQNRPATWGDVFDSLKVLEALLETIEAEDGEAHDA